MMVDGEGGGVEVTPACMIGDECSFVTTISKAVYSSDRVVN